MKRVVKLLIWGIVILFILINSIASIQAYKFTHFTTENVKKTQKPEKLSFPEKLKTLFLGVNNPRPTDSLKPVEKFEDIKIKSNVNLDCWLIPDSSNRGTVIIFHGYGSSKSALINNSDQFYGMGFNVLLVDFIE